MTELFTRIDPHSFNIQLEMTRYISNLTIRVYQEGLPTPSTIDSAVLTLPISL